MAGEPVCGCGRSAVDVVRVASEDGVLLIPVCAECTEDPTAGEHAEPARSAGPPRRPPATMTARGEDSDSQQRLPLDDTFEAERGAA